MRYKSLWQKVLTGLMAFILVGTALGVPEGHAADLSGERVVIIVPFREGGGTDTYIRFLAPFFREHLPGNPSIVIQNIPGAGSIAGANKFERARTDGTQLLAVSTSTVMNYIMEDPRVNFQPEKWKPVLNTPIGAVVYARTDVGLTGEPIADVKKLAKSGKEVVFGGNSPTSGELPRLLSMDMLGLNVKPVFGINRGPVRLGFERGEFTINYDTTSAYLQETSKLVEEGVAQPLYAFGVWDYKQEKMVRDPSFPDIPHYVEVYEAIHGEKPSGPAWNALFTLFSVSVMHSKAIVLPKGTSDEVVKMYEQAINDIIADPEFQERKYQMIGAYDQITGEDAKANLMNAITMDDEARNWLYDWLEREHDVEFKDR